MSRERRTLFFRGVLKVQLGRFTDVRQRLLYGLPLADSAWEFGDLGNIPAIQVRGQHSREIMRLSHNTTLHLSPADM